MAKVTMSLNQIRAFGPCIKGWQTLLTALGKTTPDDEQINLAFIVESNGIQDAIWCMRVNWFEHKSLYMEFVQGCKNRAKEYAATAATAYATDAAYAAYATAATAYATAYATADAAYAAAATAYAAANAAAAAAEKQQQKEHLLQLLVAE